MDSRVAGCPGLWEGGGYIPGAVHRVQSVGETKTARSSPSCFQVDYVRTSIIEIGHQLRWISECIFRFRDTGLHGMDSDVLAETDDRKGEASTMISSDIYLPHSCFWLGLHSVRDNKNSQFL